MSAADGHLQQLESLLDPIDLHVLADRLFTTVGGSSQKSWPAPAVAGLKVIARTSPFAFRGKEQDIRRIAEALVIDADEPMVLYNVACVQSLAKQYEDALDTLEKGVQSGSTQKNWLEHDHA